MKRIISVALVLLLATMCFAALSVSAAVDDEFIAGDLKYKVLTEPEGDTNGTVEVIKNDYTGEKYVIPHTVTNDEKIYDVVSIGNDAFAGDADAPNETLKTVIIGDNVKTIGIFAFDYSTKLEHITLGKNLEEIKSHAFRHCHSLKSVDLGNNLKTIRQYAFAYVGLESVVIPDSVTLMEGGAFQNSELKEVDFGKGAYALQGFSFSGTNLTNITIPESIIEIHNSVFADTSSLINVTLVYDGEKDISGTPFRGTNAIITNKLAAPKNLKWNGSSVKWDAIGKADSYILSVYKDYVSEENLLKSVTLTDTSYDLSDVVLDSETYCFTVKAIAESYEDSDISTSPILINTLTGAKGDTGPKGDTGDVGDAGASGTNGIGIAAAAINENGELIITLTDGSQVNAGVVKAEAEGGCGAAIGAVSVVAAVTAFLGIAILSKRKE